MSGAEETPQGKKPAEQVSCLHDLRPELRGPRAAYALLRSWRENKTQQGKTRAVINSHQTVTGDFTRDPDLAFPDAELRDSIRDAVGAQAADFVDGTALATALLGDPGTAREGCRCIAPRQLGLV